MLKRANDQDHVRSVETLKFHACVKPSKKILSVTAELVLQLSSDFSSEIDTDTTTRGNNCCC